MPAFMDVPGVGARTGFTLPVPARPRDAFLVRTATRLRERTAMPSELSQATADVDASRTSISPEEREGLRLLARFLVRAYLKDRRAAAAPEDPEGESPRDAEPV
jgi:hypothetical protein